MPPTIHDAGHEKHADADHAEHRESQRGVARDRKRNLSTAGGREQQYERQ
jgi:hypothetical protein